MIPVNEQGTIVLFSKLADELGYTFKSIGTGCPDAILLKAGMIVRVEFEHKAGNFRQHKHDPASVDLVICWEDDWPTAPVPILSLSNYVTLTRSEVAKVPRWMRCFAWLRDVRISFRQHWLEAKVRTAQICPVCLSQMSVQCRYATEDDGDGYPGSTIWRCPKCGYTNSERAYYYAA